jgi:bifunctional non-homologous end joining protein LigD
MATGTPESFPTRLQPMMAQLAKAPFRDPAWLFEPKLDGYRMLVFLRGGSPRLVSRRNIDYTRQFPAIGTALKALGDDDCVLDGEIIALDADGKPSFNALQNRAGAASGVDIAAAERRSPALFFCFDLLHHAGRSLRALPYVERRARLQSLVRPTTHLQVVHADDDGVALYAAALETGFEGVVAKRKTSIYRPGQRSPEWLKIKHTTSAEFVVGGYSQGKGERERFGSLVVGYRDEEGKLRYAANVGVGFDEDRIADLLGRFAPLVTARSPFADKVEVRAGTTWLEPELVAEVTFAEWTRGGRLRAPVFLRLRDDVDPASIRRLPDPAAETARPPVALATTSERSQTVAGSGPDADDVRRVLAALEQPVSLVEIGGQPVRLTTLQRVYWPAEPTLGAEAVTKLDLIRYLVRMSPLVLPHLRDRPLTLFRWPGGIQGRRMLQKHPESALPAFVETARIFSETKGVDDEYLLCNNLATLVWLADMGTLEIHVWHSRVRAADAPSARSPSSGSAASLAGSQVNFPDYMLFDLDPYIYSGRERSGAEPEPSEEGFEQARQVAFWLKDVLDGMSLPSFVKTTGKTGLHVVVPIEATVRYDVVRGMAGAICQHLLREHPETITLEWDTRKRRGKVFMDFNMNVRGKSTIAPYCPRGLQGAPVSMPLGWRELASARPTQFRIGTAPTGRKRRDPWSGVLDRKQSLEGTLAAMHAQPATSSSRRRP